MLYTPCENDEVPLFSEHAPLVRCGSSGPLLVIQPPSCVSTVFDWSDFPVVSDTPASFLSGSRLFQESDTRDVPLLVPSRSSLSSCDSLTSCEEETSPTRTQQTSEEKKQVTFADTIQVRTHQIILGTHPFCTQLPLELGWEYNETSQNSLLLEDFESQKSPLSHKPRRLSYLERKRLLLDITQMTSEDIRETTLQHAKNSTQALMANCPSR